ncbi:MAG TPA: bifunctional glycosyltransferase family 2 protein/CDP-glycerol:glycerophosphate glycerophosphotransferase [Mycobacteriales bacterium]|nr:bifunctional glycosyltransferase family 2 protein/CDP-glycerol:glycerophosphate glycerophosphotransferase [Mycobacteriales bacterium]
MTTARPVGDSEDAVVLSMVFAVHGDQAYLDGAVRSVLEHPGRDVEVVVVDNGSTDHVPEVLAELSQLDDRIVPIRLDEAVPQGTARQVGLEAARGRYVWFMDATDLLQPGAVAAVVRLVDRRSPDVAVLDFVTGGSLALLPSPHSPLVRRIAAAGSVSVEAMPELLDLAPWWWSLVVKKALLDEWGIDQRGQRSDAAFGYCALLAAGEVTATASALYRRRRPFNTVNSPAVTGDEKDLLDAVATVFSFLSAHPVIADRRRFATGRIVGLATQRLNRLPASRRRDFAERLIEVSRRQIGPTDALPPGRVTALRMRLVRGGHRTAYLAVEAALRIARRLVLASGRFRARLAPRLARVVERLRLLEYSLHRRLPLRRDLAVFAAYWYRSYACNPRAIYEKLRELAPEVRGVWVVLPGVKVPDGVDSVVVGTRAYYRLLARATYFVNNVGFPDHWKKRRGTVLLHTHHGTPLKKMGLDQYDVGGPLQRPLPAKHLSRWQRWDYSLSSNLLSTLVWERVYPAAYRTLEYGYPRNDRLVTAGADEAAPIKAALGIEADRKVLLYAPTHREYERTLRQILDPVALARSLGDDWVILSRAHYYNATGQPIAKLAGGRVVDVTSYESVEELCLAADVLVTDYSSIMFDYAVLDRPILIYAPDWEIYQLLRGTYFDLMNEAPGVVCRTQAELAEALTSGAYCGDVATKALELFRNRFCAWEDGMAAERVVRRLFLGEQPPLPLRPPA